MKSRSTQKSRPRASTLPAFSRDRRGTTAVEFAMVVPFLLIFLLGTFQVGHAVYTHGQIKFAIQEVSRMVMVDPNMTTAEVQDLVRDSLTSVNIQGLAKIVVTDTDNGDDTATTTINVRVPFQVEIPMVTSYLITLEAATSVLRRNLET